jgi:hypothetical protein
LSTTWVEQGPGPILGSSLTEGLPGSPAAGAVQALVADPTNPDVVYAGSVNGGVWKTTNATAANPHWTPLTDLQLPPYPSIRWPSARCSRTPCSPGPAA